ncbi:MAG: DinB family protein [Gemmatimonadota bacterium]
MERHLARPWRRLVDGKVQLLARVGRLSADARERRLTPESWSFADVVEHLMLVEQGLGSALAKAPTRERPRVVPRGRWFRFIGLRLALKGGVRIKAPVESIVPTGGLPWHALLSRWEEQRRGFEEWLLSVDPGILGDPRFKHPIVGWLTVPQALTFTADHQDHHLEQIGRIERAG